ncbi:MAG: hypothetical protein ACXAEL_09840 [Candidatus Hodarchaeales archaeon]|jgi:hypothetical protein
MEEQRIERVKFRIPSWDEAAQFMKKIAAEFNAAIEVRDADQLISTNGFELTFHPDDRGFAYITCKIHDRTMAPALKAIFAPYNT